MSVTTIPAYLARTQFGGLLQKLTTERRRFVITKTGTPTAVLLSIHDFDDMVEELDKEFQKTLTVAAREYRKGTAITLKEYMSGALR